MKKFIKVFFILSIVILISIISLATFFYNNPMARNELGVMRLCGLGKNTSILEMKLWLSIGTPVYFDEGDFNDQPELSTYFNPIWCAARSGDVEALNLLLDYGGKKFIDYNSCCNGGTPLGVAEQFKQDEAIRILKNAGAVRSIYSR